MIENVEQLIGNVLFQPRSIFNLDKSVNLQRLLALLLPRLLPVIRHILLETYDRENPMKPAPKALNIS
jgi:hypothetical protein